MLIELATLPPTVQQQILQIKVDEVVHIVDNGKVVKQLTQSTHDNFTFDMERIQQSIDSGRVTVPQFNSFEEFDAWLHRDDV